MLTRPQTTAFSQSHVQHASLSYMQSV